MTEAMSDPIWSAPDLHGRVALVTGASRGVGRGIALALGDAGATVYVTGRSVRGGETTEGLPGTIDDTADEVTARGGRGIAVRCDHTVDDDVDALFEQVGTAEGCLDVLVNNAWSGYERWDEARFDAPFWEQPLWRWELFAASLRGQFVASRFAAPLMLSAAGGLIVNISFTDGDVLLGQAAYDVCKHASDRMALSMSRELRKHGVASVALHPGFVRTERVEAAWQRIGSGPAQAIHSPEYVGRAIAALAADEAVLQRTGQRLAVGDLAEEYGFTDVDGRRPPAFHLEGRMTLATRMERLIRLAVDAGSAAR
jgi:NAD(P)-dependent dehydrogenase (short-subunit alcohol dehydrogenase family)